MSRLGDLYKAMETLRKEGTDRTRQRLCWYSELSSSFPILESNTCPVGYDTDQDGMPDEWKKANGKISLLRF